MDIQIDTNGPNSDAALRHEFGVDGMEKVTVRYGHTSKAVTKIIISDTPVSCKDRYFHQLALLVSDAIQVRDNADKYKTMNELAKGSKVSVKC